jgi:putative acetyltransferase
MSTSNHVTIREFVEGDETAFYRLNEEWILQYFVMEPKDEEIIRNPRRVVLDAGGRIFFAIRNGEPVGCCALIPTQPGEYELSKMTVTKSCRGAGIGRMLLQTVIEEARAGFRHIPPERKTPSPYARSDVSMELYLTNVNAKCGAGL